MKEEQELKEDPVERLKVRLQLSIPQRPIESKNNLILTSNSLFKAFR